jgi:hypothetical protein
MVADKQPVEASHIMMFAQSSARIDPEYFLRPKIGEPGSAPAS